jgi:hypothetical protein
MGCGSSSLAPLPPELAALQLPPQPPLFVVIVHFNPAGYARRDELFRATVLATLANADARLVTMELAMPPAAGAVCSRDVTLSLLRDVARRPDLVWGRRWASATQLVGRDVLWAKEALVNAGVAKAKALGAEYVAWVDGDVTFKDPAWAAKTVAALRRHDVVQPWSDAQLLGPDGRVTRTTRSFAHQQCAGHAWAPRPNGDAEYWHPGFAWAARVSAFERSGGLLTATLGSADLHFATALLGLSAASVPPGMSREYAAAVAAHEQRVRGLTLGVVPGAIDHGWHGSMAHRGYVERWDVLVRAAFTPAMVAEGADGVPHWTAAAPTSLRDAVRAYFARRLEDGVQLTAADVPP